MKTKNSLFASAIALVLCVAMLAGTTFAWFSDIATSKNNVIQSGSLDITMEWANDFDATTWQDATAGAIFTHDNWEPGYTDVKYIKITNKGNLNLKWRLTLEAEGTVSKLSDVIGVYCVNPATAQLTSIDGLTSAGTLTNVLNNKNVFAPTGALVPGAEVIVAMAMHMDEEAGNTYKGLSLCDEGFSVRLIATQDIGESDSFGNDDYDKDAKWPGEINFEASTSISQGQTDNNNRLVNDLIIRYNDSIYALLPAGIELAAGATEIKFTGKNVEANGNFADNARSYDIHIEGIADNDEIGKPCITVYLGALLAKDLSGNSLKLYHENTLMTRVNSVADFAINNQYTYDPATGEVVLYVDNFSVFSALNITADVWDETSDTSWYNENDTEFTLTTAEQFAGFRDLVDGGNTFAGKTVKLAADIDLNGKLFDPIGFGYYNAETNTRVFMGTFDGGNHTVYNLYQNGWDLDPDKTNYSTYTYSTAGGGLFASIKDATIKNIAVSGANIVFECVDIGIVVGYAQGTCHFENIVVTDSQIANYNRATGGVVGEVCYGPYGTDISNGYSHTFKNIVVDSSVVVSSLWGSFDTLCGGVIGGKWGDATVKMENVTVAAELDVFSDVTAAYQWYAYRRCGMLIGHTEQNSPKKALNAAAEFLTCEKVYVYYGDWTNYTYYQFTNQTDKDGNSLWYNNYPWVRAEAGLNNGAFSNARYGNPVIEGSKINTLELAEANKTAYTPIIFNQLYGGGQGVYGCNEHEGVTIGDKYKKTVYIKNNAGWENLKLYYWFANGNDTWATLIDGITLNEENGVYKVDVPAQAHGFMITADGDNKTDAFIISDLIDGALYNLNREHIHEYQWIIDSAPTDKVEGAKHEVCTGCGDIRNENTPIAKLECDGHTPLTKVEAKAATCLEKGNAEYYTCLKCGKIYSDENGYFEIHEKDYEIPAHGHKLVDDKCTVCGIDFSVTITLNAGITSGAYTGEIAAPVVGVSGEEIILPHLEAVEDWYLDYECTNRFTGTTFSEDLTLYAKLVSNTAQQITVLSYNIDNSENLQPASKNGKTMVAVDKAGYPDIICLQEAGLNWQKYPSVSALSEYTGSYQNDKGISSVIFYKTKTFTALGSNKVPEQSPYLHSVILQRNKADGTSDSQGALLAVFNIQLVEGSDASAEATRKGQIERLITEIKGAWNSYGIIPVIVTGDFNSTSSGIAYNDMIQTHGFFDTSAVAKDSTTNPTHNSGSIRDYIFVDYRLQHLVETYDVYVLGHEHNALFVKVTLPNLYCKVGSNNKPNSHNIKQIEAKPATCLEAGNKEYYTCTLCNKVYADEHATIEITEAACVIPALGHEAGAAATCETAKTCTRCGEELAPALGHDWTNDCDPDCNNSCGETRVPPHYYEWVEPALDPEGVGYYECTICHKKKDENTPVEESTETTSP